MFDKRICRVIVVPNINLSPRWGFFWTSEVTSAVSNSIPNYALLMLWRDSETSRYYTFENYIFIYLINRKEIYDLMI